MRLHTGQNILADIDLAAGLTEQQAERIYAQGKEAVVFVLLALAKLATEQKPTNLPAAIAADPSTPSAQKPVFTKPNVNDKKRRKKPGRKDGHAGNRREMPTRIDRTSRHLLS
jgi:transposase